MKLSVMCILRAAGWLGPVWLTVACVGGCTVIPDAEKHAPPSIHSENKVLSAAAQTEANETGMMVVKSFGVSMLPTYREGTIFLVAPTKWEDLKTGDVVAYRNSAGTIMVHRLIHDYGHSWLVQGDNNAEADREVVTPENLVGVMYTSFLPGTEIENKQ